jgi:hypothetical protein
MLLTCLFSIYHDLDNDAGVTCADFRPRRPGIWVSLMNIRQYYPDD